MHKGARRRGFFFFFFLLMAEFRGMNEHTHDLPLLFKPSSTMRPQVCARSLRSFFIVTIYSYCVNVYQCRCCAQLINCHHLCPRSFRRRHELCKQAR